MKLQFILFKVQSKVGAQAAFVYGVTLILHLSSTKLNLLLQRHHRNFLALRSTASVHFLSALSALDKEKVTIIVCTIHMRIARFAALMTGKSNHTTLVNRARRGSELNQEDIQISKANNPVIAPMPHSTKQIARTILFGRCGVLRAYTKVMAATTAGIRPQEHQPVRIPRTLAATKANSHGIPCVALESVGGW